MKKLLIFLVVLIILGGMAYFFYVNYQKIEVKEGSEICEEMGFDEYIPLGDYEFCRDGIKFIPIGDTPADFDFAKLEEAYLEWRDSR